MSTSLPTKSKLVGTPSTGEFKAALGDMYDHISNIDSQLSGITGGAWDATVPYSVKSFEYMSGFKNKVINGNMDRWVRGASFSINSGSYGYTADRWFIVNNTDKVATISLGTFNAFDGSDLVKRLRINFATAPTTGYIVVSQRIEDVTTLAGYEATLSFAQASPEQLLISPYVAQYLGVGGDTTIATNFSDIQSTTNTSMVSGNITVPSLVGKKIMNGNYLELAFRLPIRSTQPFSIGRVQFEAGSVQTPFEFRHVATEDMLCRRYAQLKSTNSVPIIDLVPELRATPTITQISNGYLYDAEYGR